MFASPRAWRLPMSGGTPQFRPPEPFMHVRRRSLQLLLTTAVLPVLVLVPLAFATMETPRATFEGRYVLRHSDDFAGGKAMFQPALELASGDVKELSFSPGR